MTLDENLTFTKHIVKLHTLKTTTITKNRRTL